MKVFVLFVHGFLSVESLTSFGECKTHAFFYLWYGIPSSKTTSYKHWNHEVLPHWTEKENKKWSQIIGQQFSPPEEIHAKFYPHRGLYDSEDEIVLKAQFAEMKRAGICGVVLSWWGRPDEEGTHDTQGVNTDSIVESVVKAAADVEGIYVGFHLEPYAGRNAKKVAQDVRYLQHRFRDFSTTLLMDNRQRVVFYIYDSYHVASSDWKRELKDLRDEACFVGLVLDRKGLTHVVNSAFDAGYTYFASDGFSFGSSTSNWNHISTMLHKHDVAFVPSVGAGYDDSSIRPWNFRNTKNREDGVYYERMFHAAITSNPDAISITSYNEWGEGTQIESASPRRVLSSDQVKLKNPHLLNEQGDRVYASYKEENPYFYIDLTRRFVKQWEENGNYHDATLL